MATEVNKIPVYSVSDLKNTTDDALTPYLTTLPKPYTFDANYTNSNIRFLLGYSAVLIAGFTFYADRTLGWEATRSPWVIVAVVSYFVLNSLLALFWGVGAGEVFSGTRASGEKITVQSLTKKQSPIYRVRVRYTSPQGKVLQEKEIEAPFTSWFSAEGVYYQDQFQQWISGEIDVLGLAAKERAGLKKKGTK